MKLSEITLLIIDDNFSEDALEDELKLRGCNSIFIMNAEDGLAYIHQHLADPIIVLLDIAMPGLNGHQVLEEIRKKSSLIPVILFSGILEEQETFSDFINNHADGFIKKDESSEKIITEIEKVAEGLSFRIDNALEDWLVAQPEDVRSKPIFSFEGQSYNSEQLLKEIRLQTRIGKILSNNLLKYAVDSVARKPE